LGLSGVLLGSVIVLIMALLPGGIMGDREIEDFILKE